MCNWNRDNDFDKFWFCRIFIDFIIVFLFSWLNLFLWCYYSCIIRFCWNHRQSIIDINPFGLAPSFLLIPSFLPLILAFFRNLLVSSVDATIEEWLWLCWMCCSGAHNDSWYLILVPNIKGLFQRSHA